MGGVELHGEVLELYPAARLTVSLQMQYNHISR